MLKCGAFLLVLVPALSFITPSFRYGKMCTITPSPGQILSSSHRKSAIFSTPGRKTTISMMALPNNPRLGTITLVGAGPGDPDLLTVGVAKLLSSGNPKTTLVIADRLVSEEILDMVKGELRIVLEKRPACAETAQNRIYDWVQEAVHAGKDVIRLKIGDPFVFGRGGEEILKFRSFGVEPKIMPGISSAFSAPLLAGVPVTHRGAASTVLMSTGYGKEGSDVPLLPYAKGVSSVFLMAVGRLDQLSSNLIKRAGYPADIPVSIIQEASTPHQRELFGPLCSIADGAKLAEMKAPATIVVGEVCAVMNSYAKEDKAAVSSPAASTASAVATAAGTTTGTAANEGDFSSAGMTDEQQAEACEAEWSYEIILGQPYRVKQLPSTRCMLREFVSAEEYAAKSVEETVYVNPYHLAAREQEEAKQKERAQWEQQQQQQQVQQEMVHTILPTHRTNGTALWQQPIKRSA